MGSSLLSSLSVAYGGPFIPPGSGGAARYRSYIWPDPLQLAANAGAVQQSVGVRGRMATGGPSNVFAGYGGGNAVQIVNGMAGYAITNVLAGGGGYRFQGNICQLKTSRSLIGPPFDDQSVIRVWANLACSSGTPATQDQGLVLVHPGGIAQRIIADLAIGFGFQIGQTGIVSFLIRGPNGLLTLPITAAPFDVTKHHTYEMWLVSASQSADANLSAFIDNVAVPLPALSRSWGPGSNLPPSVFISGECNFAVQLTSDPKINGAVMHIQQLGIAWGPTLPSVA